LSRHYDGQGRLVKEYFLKNDTIKDGDYREFNDNGTVAYKGTFKNNSLVGFQYFFDENGDTIKYYHTYENHLDFPYKKWFSDGRVMFGDYTDEKENSVTWKWYNKNGKEIKKQVVYSTKTGFPIPE
jgi:antitoxin component YwqK of YwqJK toxin-antitoxin module